MLVKYKKNKRSACYDSDSLDTVGKPECERRAIIDLNRRQKLTHPESRAIIRVEEAFMKGARHDKEWDDTNDT